MPPPSLPEELLRIVQLEKSAVPPPLRIPAPFPTPVTELFRIAEFATINLLPELKMAPPPPGVEPPPLAVQPETVELLNVKPPLLKMQPPSPFSAEPSMMFTLSSTSSPGGVT